MSAGSAVAASRLRLVSSSHPLLASSLASISRNSAMARLAASVLWLLARRRTSFTISRDTCRQNADMSRNLSLMSAFWLLPNTCNRNLYKYSIPKVQWSLKKDWKLNKLLRSTFLYKTHYDLNLCLVARHLGQGLRRYLQVAPFLFFYKYI